jgi:hypothetical protein
MFFAKENAGYPKKMTQYKTHVQKGMSTNRNLGRICLKAVYEIK